MATAEDVAMGGASQYAGPPPPPPPPPHQQHHAPPPGGAPPPQAVPAGAGAEFFLSNYRLGKTLGIGSFGKVRAFFFFFVGARLDACKGRKTKWLGDRAPADLAPSLDAQQAAPGNAGSQGGGWWVDGARAGVRLRSPSKPLTPALTAMHHPIHPLFLSSFTRSKSRSTS
jgi:hypothetical protein